MYFLLALHATVISPQRTLSVALLRCELISSAFKILRAVSLNTFLKMGAITSFGQGFAQPDHVLSIIFSSYSKWRSASLPAPARGCA